MAAIVFRLTLLPLTPPTGAAIWRAHWDGKIEQAGFNPYQYPPSNGLFSPIRTAAVIPSAQQPAYQAPFAERLFLWGYEFGGSVAGMKILFTGLDLLLIWALVRKLRRYGWPPQRVLIYAWSPLAVLEIAGYGRFEPAAALLLLLGLDWAARRPRLGGLALVTAGLTQLYALALLPLVLARAGRVWRSLTAIVAVWVGLLGFRYVWMDQHFALAAVVAAVRAHAAATPVYNAGLFALAAAWFGRRGAFVLAAAVVLAALILALVRRRAVTATSAPGNNAVPIPAELPAALFVLGALLLVLPQVYPWALLWMLPLLVFFPEAPWIYFSLAVLFAPLLPDRAWVLWLEYGPLFALLIWQARRLTRGPCR